MSRRVTTQLKVLLALSLLACTSDTSDIGGPVLGPDAQFAVDEDYPRLEGPQALRGFRTADGLLRCEGAKLTLDVPEGSDWVFSKGEMIIVTMKWSKIEQQWYDIAIGQLGIGPDRWYQLLRGRYTLRSDVPRAQAFLVFFYLELIRNRDGHLEITGAGHELWCYGPDFYSAR